MAVDILNGEKAVIYCNTTDWALGPIFDSVEHAEDFLRWMREAEHAEVPMLPLMSWPTDPRSYSDENLERLYCLWRDQRCDDEGQLREGVAA